MRISAKKIASRRGMTVKEYRQYLKKLDQEITPKLRRGKRNKYTLGTEVASAMWCAAYDKQHSLPLIGE